MSRVIASITTSLDGFVTGPDDRAGQGLGVGGERLHHWVMGGPWTYESERAPGQGMTDVDQAWLGELTAGLGAGVCGRGMYEAAGAWGGRNPFAGPMFVVTHRVADQPEPDAGFTFVTGVAQAVAAAHEAAGERDVSIAGGADVIRQALAAGLVDELAVSVAPVILGAGRPLWDDGVADHDLEILAVRHSPYAVHTRYRVVRPAPGEGPGQTPSSPRT